MVHYPLLTGSVNVAGQGRQMLNGRGMTQLWSLVRLFVMNFLILLICSESYQTLQAGDCLFQSLYINAQSVILFS